MSGSQSKAPGSAGGYLQAKAQKIDDALAAKAFTVISDVFDRDGMVIQPHQMERDVAAAVKKLKRTEIKRAKGTDGGPELVGHTVEIEMVDALPALGERLYLFTLHPSRPAPAPALLRGSRRRHSA